MLQAGQGLRIKTTLVDRTAVPSLNCREQTGFVRHVTLEFEFSAQVEPGRNLIPGEGICSSVRGCGGLPVPGCARTGSGSSTRTGISSASSPGDIQADPSASALSLQNPVSPGSVSQRTHRELEPGFPRRRTLQPARAAILLGIDPLHRRIRSCPALDQELEPILQSHPGFSHGLGRLVPVQHRSMTEPRKKPRGSPIHGAELILS